MICSSYIVLDFETTGFSSEFDQVIEVGAIKVLSNGNTERFHSLVRPTVSLSVQIQKLTGITPEELRGAPAAEFVFAQLAVFSGDLPIFAHNSSFDSKFYFAQMKKIGIVPKNRFYCTLTLSRKLFPHFSGHKLEDLCREFSIDHSQAHRALADVEATLSLLKQICGHIIDQTGRSDIDFALLEEIAQTPVERLAKLLTREISLF